MPEILKNIDAYTQPSYSLKNRIIRLIWNIVYFLLFRFSLIPFHPWRSFLLRCFGAKIGKGCHIYPGVIIWAPWNLEIGDYVGIASGVLCHSMAKIKLGDKVVISQGTRLYTGSHDYEDPRFPLVTKPITVETNAWIAAEAFVFPGVTIGKGAVIGARSVITKDMPARMVCAGNPCRPIKPREMKK
ncbi:MAG: colanic acid biosynthesis acetyltransferase WcaF [Candidatus Omnitrophica bacterium]|nr:colanic acid biosynthesis acetyltransferase WcaF [Candidatus Omnitrophota bacterium]